MRDADDSAGVLAVGADGAVDGTAAHCDLGVFDHLAGDACGIEVSGVVGALGAADVGRDITVGHVHVAPHQGDESGHVAFVVGGDVGHHVQVVDDGVVGVAVAQHVTERCQVTGGCGGGEGQRFVVTVEGAEEVVVVVAGHAADADVRA